MSNIDRTKTIDENPEWKAADFGAARPASKVVGKGTAAALTKPRGRPRLDQSERRKQVNLRLAPDLIEGLRATGPGWQRRVELVLERSLASGALTSVMLMSGPKGGNKGARRAGPTKREKRA